MNNFYRKSINHAYKHMTLSVTHSPQSICTKFISSWNNLLVGATGCQRSVNASQ